MGEKFHLLFSLGCHSKQAGDERNLPHTVPFCDAAQLPFPSHVHDLIARASFATPSRTKSSPAPV